MSKTAELEQLFKKELTKLFDDLMVRLNNDADLIVATTLIWNYKISDIIGYMYKKILPDEKEYGTLKGFGNYIMKNDIVFGILPADKIEKTRNIWAALDNDNKKSLWKYFQFFVKISSKYKNLLDDKK